MHDLLYQVHCQCEATYNTGSRHKYLTEPNRQKRKKKHKQINNLTDLLVAVKKIMYLQACCLFDEYSTLSNTDIKTQSISSIVSFLHFLTLKSKC